MALIFPVFYCKLKKLATLALGPNLTGIYIRSFWDENCWTSPTTAIRGFTSFAVNVVLVFSASVPQRCARSRDTSTSVASQSIWGVKHSGGEMFDFGRITLFFLGYHLSKHKMTTCSKYLEGPFRPRPLQATHVDTSK